MRESRISTGTMPHIYIGTSGWNYDHWKGIFYPQKCPKKKWLDFYVETFPTVEVNATFYRHMKPSTFQKWRETSPEGFVWAVKANRFITHIRKLHDTKESLDRFMDSATNLEEKLGVILFQLPPTLVFDEHLFDSFCADLPENFRYTLEARHPSWTGEKALSALKKQNIAWCISDTAGRYPYLEAITSEFVYIRLHGSRKLYASNYTREELAAWAEKILAWNKDTYVYFDNDFMGYAPHNAQMLNTMLQGR